MFSFIEKWLEDPSPVVQREIFEACVMLLENQITSVSSEAKGREKPCRKRVWYIPAKVVAAAAASLRFRYKRLPRDERVLIKEILVYEYFMSEKVSVGKATEAKINRIRDCLEKLKSYQVF